MSIRSTSASSAVSLHTPSPRSACRPLDSSDAGSTLSRPHSAAHGARSSQSSSGFRALPRALLLSLSCLIGGAFATSALAAEPEAAAVHPSPNASATATLQAAVEGTITAIQGNPSARGGDPAATATVVRSHFLPYTDFRRTARLATGDAWNKASPAQQEQIFQAFQTLLTRVYAAQLTQIQGQKVSFSFGAPTAVPKSSDVVIASTVHTASDDFSTRYRLEKTRDGYRVYDIDLMGIWLVQVYQQQFAAQLRAGGVDALIKYLNAHNAQDNGG